MDNIAAYARAYADALDRLERARLFMKTPWPKDEAVKVTWLTGSATSGYQELSKMISEMISQEMPDLLGKALSKLEVDVHHAHQKLMGATELGHHGRMKAGSVT